MAYLSVASWASLLPHEARHFLPCREYFNQSLTILFSKKITAKKHHDGQYTYLRKMNASPATNFFELTKTLHPVVSRWRLGWPANDLLISSILRVNTEYCSYFVLGYHVMRKSSWHQIPHITNDKKCGESRWFIPYHGFSFPKILFLHINLHDARER
jgi:hypothetical protein